MALVNGGYFALYGHKEILVNSSLKATKKNGYGHLKNSGERFRAILALLLVNVILMMTLYFLYQHFTALISTSCKLLWSSQKFR